MKKQEALQVLYILKSRNDYNKTFITSATTYMNEFYLVHFCSAIWSMLKYFFLKQTIQPTEMIAETMWVTSIVDLPPFLPHSFFLLKPVLNLTNICFANLVRGVGRT